MKICTICSAEFDPAQELSGFAQAGEWLAKEVWDDPGLLCPVCLENRGMLSMMYLHEHNT